MNVEEYLKNPSPIKRLSLLSKMLRSKKSIPMDMAFDLLELDLPIAEHELILRLVDVKKEANTAELEQYIVENLARVDTDKAALYIHSWSHLNSRRLSKKILEVVNQSGCPQRVRYTVLIYAELFDHQALLTQYASKKDLAEYSDAYHALLLDKALVFGFYSKALIDLSKDYLKILEKTPYPESKALLNALIYLKKNEKDFEENYQNSHLSTGWKMAFESISVQNNSYQTPAEKNPKSAPTTVEPKLSQKDSRSWLFDYLYRNKKTLSKVKDGPWKIIADCYREPTEGNLAKLTAELRQETGVFKQVFYKAFSAFAKQETAVLKILDDLHTEHPYEQGALIDSLVANSTPRAAQELFNLIGRSFVKPDLKLKIARKLCDFDLASLQKQIRAVISEVGSLQISLEQKTEIQEVLSEYIDSNIEIETATNKASSSNMVRLAKLPAIYDHQSAEVKRALRTGLFFHEQVKASDQEATMDLSPVIDMQYKAIEIYLRESFQQAVDVLVRDGVLQRKLDLLGYSRPIQEKMSLFENYIHSMPIITNIPYFSKFKLRKMLIALCQFRPSKRFTLDGLKAFALFFLCFARQDCRYGLQGLFPLAFANDQSLFSFCQKLHELQDFRNRAVHEGLPPGAENNIEKTWEQTAAVILEISRLNEAAEFMKKHQESIHTPEPVIIRKGA